MQSGYFNFFTSPLPPFLAKLWLHGHKAERKTLLYFDPRRCRNCHQKILEVWALLAAERLKKSKVLILAVRQILIGGCRDRHKNFEIDTPEKLDRFLNWDCHLFTGRYFLNMEITVIEGMYWATYMITLLWTRGVQIDDLNWSLISNRSNCI